MKLTKEEFLAAIEEREKDEVEWRIFDIQSRYLVECKELFYLAKRQLNLEKNAKKGNFEDLCDLKKIYSFLLSEVTEVKNELFMDVMFQGTREKEKINYQRAREEIGDVAACLVGLLAKLNKMEKEEK